MDDSSSERSFGQLPYVKEALSDAELLLKFASKNGLVVDDDSRNYVLHARAKLHDGLDESSTAKLLIALSRLSKAVAPVTAKSLREYANNKLPAHCGYWAIGLAVILVAWSTLSFVTSHIAASINRDVTEANDLALKLNVEFAASKTNSPQEHSQSAPCLLTNDSAPSHSPSSNENEQPSQAQAAAARGDLQKYAEAIRDIDMRTYKLSHFTNLYSILKDASSIDPFWCMRKDPEALHNTFELWKPITDYPSTVERLTETYQRVRYFSLKVTDDISFYYGAVSSCILPVLYALLGAYAFRLRQFERLWSSHSYVPGTTDSARFTVAIIGGTVVGLFSTFMGSNEVTAVGRNEVTASPLAVGFLVGYSVDIFFNFIESLSQFSFRMAGTHAPPLQKTSVPTSGTMLATSPNDGFSG